MLFLQQAERLGMRVRVAQKRSAAMAALKALPCEVVEVILARVRRM